MDKAPKKPKRLPNNPFEESMWNFILYCFNRPLYDKKIEKRKKKYQEDCDRWLKYGDK